MENRLLRGAKTASGRNRVDSPGPPRGPPKATSRGIFILAAARRLREAEGASLKSTDRERMPHYRHNAINSGKQHAAPIHFPPSSSTISTSASQKYTA